ncbi:2'-5' RNA ligase [Kitasatospora sp. GP30]|jgi:2'-5' RNA ligase|uniref:2'-5' RNA ligase family protein n=1 Tax=Kitasatospora sp. GP30 TaxID=3035084 RepID=UPI000C70E79D|nr:2'-5' RNA ligase family protein [Kitasatospora sp. GP30]MDH6138493.1 2'-5' RNA ligase [Kitasatospora sp. GP30]
MDSFFDRVRHRWPAGREDLHLHILPPPEISTALVAHYRELTHREPLVPVKPEWFHVTLLHSGPMDQLRFGEVEAITDRLHQRFAQTDPFTLTLHWPNVGNVALECPGTPGEPSRRLWQACAEEVGAVTAGRFPLVPTVHYPHATIAYSTGPVPDRAELKAWLSDHGAEPVTFTAERIAVVAQSHDEREITWRPLAEVKLGTAA